MRLIPTNKVGRACERVRLPRLPRDAGFDQERGQSKVEKDTVTLNEKQGEVHPRREDKTPNDTLRVEFDVRSVVTRVTTSTWSFTINEEKGEVLPWRKDTTSTAVRTDVAKDVMSAGEAREDASRARHQRRCELLPGQGGAEGTEDRVLTLHTSFQLL